MSVIRLPATLVGLTTRHNFHKGRVDYAIEIVILGKKFTIPVTEDFVARLDATLDEDAPIPERREHRPPEQQSMFEEEEGTPDGYSLGSLERDPEDYTYEEIEKL